jgi:broad specificity phosphatase PhoE
MKITFVRHGEINSNIRRIYSGRSQEQLNANGVLQAKSVARALKNSGISHIFSGPLPRVIETARYIAAEIGVESVTLDAFNELVMGSWEGLSENDVAKQFPKEWKIWNTSPAALSIEGRETLLQLQNRSLAGVIQAVNMVKNSGQICIVSHVAVIRVLQLHAEGRSLDDYKKLEVPNATPLTLEFDHDRLH